MYNHQLRVFVCVADCGSFSKAAERLFISSTAVMKQINALEKHLELQLLERSSRGVTLTPAGQIICRHARFLFDYSEHAIQEARLTAAEAQKAFCIGTSILNPCKPFMELWYRFNENFPGYQAHIIPFEDDHAGILQEIDALGVKFDFLIGACDSRQWLEHCQFYPLGVYRHCIAVPREHPLAQKPLLELSDLDGETVMLVRQGDSPSVDQVRAALSQRPRVRLLDTPQFYDMEVFNRCVQNGCLLMTLDCWAQVHPALVTIPVRWDFTIPYGLLYAKRPDPDVDRFLDLLRTNHVGNFAGQASFFRFSNDPLLHLCGNSL